MKFITAIPEGQVLTHSKGVYRQVAAFERGGRVYAKHGAGYVRLNQGGSTSAPNIRRAEIDTPNGIWSEKSGYVTYEGATE